MKFIDQINLRVKAGDGGHGCIAFLREKSRPKGGPSGGDGGNGGSVILKVDRQLSTLHDISYYRHYRAERGQHGQGSNKHGKNGADIEIVVPAGTIVRDIKAEKILCDLTTDGEVYIVAKGGNGGFGNARFKTQTNTAPRVANDGQKGEELVIELELKILADVGLVGFPNAGKSTLLSRLSAAKPKIADYPFTTLVPNLGIVKYSDYKSFVMADIPGLIEGASDGKGLGSRFLKHIERTRVLVFIIDCTSLDIMNQYQTLKNELMRHNLSLNDRPSILLLSKIDIMNEEEFKSQLLPNNILTLQVSAVTGEQIFNCINEIAQLYETTNEVEN